MLRSVAVQCGAVCGAARSAGERVRVRVGARAQLRLHQGTTLRSFLLRLTFGSLVVAVLVGSFNATRAQIEKEVRELMHHGSIFNDCSGHTDGKRRGARSNRRVALEGSW